jgi:hypothetical protein
MGCYTNLFEGFMGLTTHARSNANESEIWFVVFDNTDSTQEKTKIVRRGNPLQREEVKEWADITVEVNSRHIKVADIYCV